MEQLERLKVQMRAVEVSIVMDVSDGTLLISHDTHPFPGSVYR
jgi:hypothetical protein